MLLGILYKYYSTVDRYILHSYTHRSPSNLDSLAQLVDLMDDGYDQDPHPPRSHNGDRTRIRHQKCQSYCF